jgi:Macrocin-O-methyltransferase (TylF)
MLGLRNFWATCCDAWRMLRNYRRIVRAVETLEAEERFLAAVSDPVTGATYDYPEPARRIKLAVAAGLASAVDYIQSSRVQGEIAEFGIGSGWTSAVLARSLAADSSCTLHLFDSFAGLPQSTSPIDQAASMVRSGIWGPGTCDWKLTPEILERTLSSQLKKSKLRIYPGWFSQTLPEIPDGLQFALVHLDCDLYQSTLEVLEAMFTRRHLSPGAILLFDDWTCNQCDPNLGQQKAWNTVVAKYRVEFMDFGFYSHAGRRFIYLKHSNHETTGG